MSETVMVPAFGMLCLMMFVVLIMAAGIGLVVMFVRLISGSTPAPPPPYQPHHYHQHPVRQPIAPVGVAVFKGFLALSALLLVAGIFLGLIGVSRTTIVKHATVDPTFNHGPIEAHQFEQIAERTRQQAEDVAMRTRQQAEDLAYRTRQQADDLAYRTRQQMEDAARRRGVPVPSQAPSAPVARSGTARSQAPASPVPPVPPMPEPVSAAEAVALANTTLPSEPPTADRSTVESTSPTGTPDWIKAGPRTVGESQFVVVSSKQYATATEAFQDADRQVVALLRNDLKKYTPHVWVRPNEEIGIPESFAIAVRNKHVETVQRDFGSFFAPMSRVWYQVELSPATREPGLIRWRAALATTRTLSTLGGLLAALCVPFGVVAFSRGNRWTNDRYRSLWASGIGAAILVTWVAVAVFITRFGVLWG